MELRYITKGKGLEKFVRFKEVSFYGGSFSYILQLLGQKESFVISRTRLYRGLLYRGSTVKSLHSISTHHQPVIVKLSSNKQIVTTGSKVRF